MSVKSELRKALIKKRKTVSGRGEKDKKILSFLTSLDDYNSADTLLVYVPLEGEINTEPLIENAIKNGKTVAVPYCENRCGKMSFYVIGSLDELSVGTFGVREPDRNFNKRLEDFENSIIIVPGVSFSRSGHRLGYGGGYYDRFLQNYRGKSVGLCYEDMICDSIPVQEHDIAVNILITDKSTQSLGG